MSAQDILVVAETSQQAVADITHELIGGARQLAQSTGGQVVAVLLGQEVASLAEQLAADRVLVIEDPLLASYAPDPYLAVLENVIKSVSPRVVLIGSTSIGWDLAPLLAARLDAPMAVGCQAARIEGDQVKATSSICGGKLLADVTLDRAPAVLMVMPGSFRPPEAAPSPQVETQASPVPLQPGAVQFEQLELPAAGDVDITSQEVLVGVGRGIGQEDNLELAEELAEALGGAVCASRPIVDQGWLPPTRQVGKSGMTVKPKLYFALGISGAPEHQEGMAGSELIIAVNTDPKAPIFDFAHFGAQVDLLDLVEPLTEAIKAKKGG